MQTERTDSWIQSGGEGGEGRMYRESQHGNIHVCLPYVKYVKQPLGPSLF